MSVATDNGIAPVGCVTCMHAVVDFAWQLCSKVVLMVAMYVGALLSKLPVYFILHWLTIYGNMIICIIRFRITKGIKCCLYFIPSRSNNRVTEGFLKGCGQKI